MAHPTSNGRVDLQWCGGLVSDLITGNTGGKLAQSQTGGGDVDDGEVGDDAVHDALAGEREGALVDDLVAAVLGDVFHEHDDAFGAVDEVHGAAHALDHGAGDHPVREVTGGGDLHSAEDC